MTPCEWLENGLRCGKARISGEVPEEGINCERLVDQNIPQGLDPQGQLICDCTIALVSRNGWVRIGKCDPRAS